jgi:hypothetical protein
MGSGTAEMSWSHPTPPCEHPDPDHMDVTIVVEVSDGAATTTCTYRGAATGKGLPDSCSSR